MNTTQTQHTPTFYKGNFPRTYEASFVALSMVDGRELWCVDRAVCAQIEGERASLVEQVAKLRGALQKAIPCMEAAEIALRADGCYQASDKCLFAMVDARAVLAETQKGAK